MIWSCPLKVSAAIVKWLWGALASTSSAASKAPLAARCLDKGAFALGTNGREFTIDSIGGALATREIKAAIRETGAQTGGPRPIGARERSRFSGELDRLAHRALRGETSAG